MKKDAIEGNHCLIQSPPFYVRNCFSVLSIYGTCSIWEVFYDKNLYEIIMTLGSSLEEDVVWR